MLDQRALKFMPRRDATRVCAGLFDLKPSVITTPTQETITNIPVLSALPNGSKAASASLLATSSKSHPAPAAVAGPSGVPTDANGSRGSSIVKIKRSRPPRLPTLEDDEQADYTDEGADDSRRSARSSLRDVAKASSGVTPPPLTTKTPAAPWPRQPPPPTKKASTTKVSSKKRPITAVTPSNSDRPSKKSRPALKHKHSETYSDSHTSSSTATAPSHHHDLSNDWARARAPHTSSSTTPSLSPPPSMPKKSRQPQPKGWKGWALVDSDDDIDRSRLIEIDKPVILPSARQTRSGRKFAPPKALDGGWEDPDWDLT